MLHQRCRQRVAEGSGTTAVCVCVLGRLVTGEGVRCDAPRQVLRKSKPRNAKAIEEALKLEEVKGNIDALKAAAIETMETAKRRDGLEFVKTEIKLSS